MTNKTTLIKSNSNLIQPFVVHPERTTLSKEKILEMQQSSEILQDNACAILEVNIKNLDKMQEDFVIPAGSVINYGGPQFHPWIISEDWTNPACTDHSFDDIARFSDYSSQVITVIIPVEPQEGSDFCFKGDELNQGFKQKWFKEGFRGPLEVNHKDYVVDDGVFTAPFQSLNLLPFTSQVQEEEVKEETSVTISLQDACAEAEDRAIASQAETNKLSEISETLYQIQLEVNKLKAFGIEVEVKIKK